MGKTNGSFLKKLMAEGPNDQRLVVTTHGRLGDRFRIAFYYAGKFENLHFFKLRAIGEPDDLGEELTSAKMIDAAVVYLQLNKGKLLFKNWKRADVNFEETWDPSAEEDPMHLLMLRCFYSFDKMTIAADCPHREVIERPIDNPFFEFLKVMHEGKSNASLSLEGSSCVIVTTPGLDNQIAMASSLAPDRTLYLGIQSEHWTLPVIESVSLRTSVGIDDVFKTLNVSQMPDDEYPNLLIPDPQILPPSLSQGLKVLLGTCPLRFAPHLSAIKVALASNEGPNFPGKL